MESDQSQEPKIAGSDRQQVNKRAREARSRLLAELREGIDSGQLAPGDQLPTEREFAQRYAVSRKTVQSVFLELGHLGLVTRRVGSGTFVSLPRVTERQMDLVAPSVSPTDAIEARRAIEPSFHELVVIRATEEDFRRMRHRLREMETAEDQIIFKIAGYKFHLEVARATRNPLLVAMYELLIAARAKAGWETLMPLNKTRESKEAQISCNRSIYEALYARDAARANELSRFHLGEMIQTVTQYPPGV